VSGLAALGGPADRRLGVHLSSQALSQVRRGSPWVFDESIQRVTGTGDEPGTRSGDPGDLAVIFDDRRKFAAIGLWDPTSPIRVRVLHRGDPVMIDERWWRERIAGALDRRQGLFDDPATTACRLIHGENDGFGGLVIDRYGSVAVVKVYSAAWFPWLSTVVPIAVDELAGRGVVIDSVVMRTARRVPVPDVLRDHLVAGHDDAVMLIGPVPDRPVTYRERHLVLVADVLAGNKTGAFLDQRDNRMLVRSMADGARVLDVFANTGGFAVSAALGGAASVHLVDQSAPALETARVNLKRNRVSCEIRTTTGDAFEVLEALRSGGLRFDLVIIDPPAFARSAAQRDGAERAYRRLVRAGLDVLERGGILMQASCSNRIGAVDFVDLVMDTARTHAAARHLGEVVEVRRTGHPVDHPIGFDYGEYLKAVFVQLR